MSKATKKVSPVPASKHYKTDYEDDAGVLPETTISITKKTSLGKRKKSELGGKFDGSADLDLFIMSEPRKKIHKDTLSNTIDRESFRSTRNRVHNKFHCSSKTSDIPPVHSVSCGYAHTLTITNEDKLWSCGRNYYRQLCHGDMIERSKPQKTPFQTSIKYQLV